ncbi:hypothetical protein C8R43DRAFT_1176862 [Mycena crocata]|nr:hypothetical protein C8R43DRAFT_1176862 [Mycena crocata]
MKNAPSSATSITISTFRKSLRRALHGVSSNLKPATLGLVSIYKGTAQILCMDPTTGPQSTSTRFGRQINPGTVADNRSPDGRTTVDLEQVYPKGGASTDLLFVDPVEEAKCHLQRLAPAFSLIAIAPRRDGRDAESCARFLNDSTSLAAGRIIDLARSLRTRHVHAIALQILTVKLGWSKRPATFLPFFSMKDAVEGEKIFDTMQAVMPHVDDLAPYLSTQFSGLKNTNDGGSFWWFAKVWDEAGRRKVSSKHWAFTMPNVYDVFRYEGGRENGGNENGVRAGRAGTDDMPRPTISTSSAQKLDPLSPGVGEKDAVAGEEPDMDVGRSFVLVFGVQDDEETTRANGFGACTDTDTVAVGSGDGTGGDAGTVADAAGAETAGAARGASAGRAQEDGQRLVTVAYILLLAPAPTATFPRLLPQAGAHAAALLPLALVLRNQQPVLALRCRQVRSDSTSAA